jgi:hypothetical protein
MNFIKKTACNFSEKFKRQKFFLLNLLLVILCFVALPGILIYRGINEYLARQNEDLIKQKRAVLEKKLDQLEFFSSNDRFAHFLLHRLCKTENSEKADISRLKDRINQLKKLYPECFKFVVCNSKGEIVTELSDIVAYRYLYRKTFELIELFEKNLNSQKLQSNWVRKQLKRLRPLLGKMLHQKDIFLPLKSIKNGRTILSSGSKDNFHIWYGSGSNFKIIAHISRSFIRSNKGLKWASNRLNSDNSQTFSGFSEFPVESDTIFPSTGGKRAAKIVRAISEHETIKMPKENPDLKDFIACRHLNQKVRGFSFFIPDKHKNFYNSGSKFFFLLARIVTLIGFVLIVHQILFPIAISIKLKIAVFFTWSIILPLLVIGTIASRYVAQAETEIENQLFKQGQTIIETVDFDYQWFLKQLSRKTNNVFNAFFKTEKDFELDKEKLKIINVAIKNAVKHEEAMLINASGADLFTGISPNFTLNDSYIRKLSGDAVKMLTSPSVSSWKSYPSPQRHTVDGIFVKQNKITYLGAGELDMSVFLRYLTFGRHDQHKNLMAMILWREINLNLRFIKQKLTQSDSTLKNMNIAIFNLEEEKIEPYSFTDNSNLYNFFKTAENKPITQIRKFQLNGKNYVAVAKPCKHLKKILPAIFFPRSEITRKVEEIRHNALIFSIILLLLAFSTVFLLRKLIFKPLEELKTGLEAFASRNFNKRLTVVCNNELGVLIDSFNKSLETLKDLEVARIVQENILPSRTFKSSGLQILTKTTSMTKLGGDFFDIVELDEERVLLFIGDATGHGIPAALTMAMAKSAIQNNLTSDFKLKNLMENFHHLFCSLRKQGSRDLMTAIGAVINAKTGEAELVNMGHCYPILVSQAGRQTVMLETIQGFPPGFVKNRKICSQNLCLGTDDYLLFYTDGFYECCNEQKEPLGFDGLLEIISKSWNKIPEKFIEDISKNIDNWENIVQDDKTIMLVKIS